MANLKLNSDGGAGSITLTSEDNLATDEEVIIVKEEMDQLSTLEADLEAVQASALAFAVALG